MTLETDLGLGELVADRIVHTHYIVTVCARVTYGSMYTRLPVYLGTSLMALRANGTTIFGCKVFLGNHQRRFLPRCIQMLAHGAMAGLTASIGQGPAHLGHGVGTNIFLVALDALLAAFNKSRPLDVRVQGRPVNDAFILCHRPGDTQLEQDSCDY
ncbi:MAG: hypothetical protein A2993_00685 [Gammaproteobacteria bacterium RIFCSPLOWO2_01_FULL_47_190]|nr:MAG: hypothetical protein A2993_00685 [Gammaproteobacteria bacterium RIFCSPLOWO2_01_FULL_47_190]